MWGQNQNNSIAAIQSAKLSHFLVKTGGVRSRLIVNICFLLIILFVSMELHQTMQWLSPSLVAGWLVGCTAAASQPVAV